MKVEIKLYASLACHLPGNHSGNSCVLDVAEGITVAELLEQLKIPANAAKIVFVNGIHAKGDRNLKDGDRMGVFPPVAGG